MLETLVSSRVRRTLLEHLLTHPDERCYLRGLAKTLNLSISPLRRELLRLEHLGMLTAYDEANVRFYTVNRQSPLFAQLQQAAAAQTPAGHVELPAEILEEAKETPAASQPIRLASTVPAPAAQRPHSSVWRAMRLTAGMLSLVAGLALIFGSIVRFAIPKPAPRRVWVAPVVPETSFASPAAIPDATGIERAVPGQSATSGEMRSGRWRLQPGTIGGGWSQ